MNCLHVPELLMPNESIDLSKWAVVACDQFTSQKEYWEETQKIVADAPSTLNLILPEVYLGSEDENRRVQSIHKTMNTYIEDGTLQSVGKGFVLVKRGIHKEYQRNGLVVEIDLEAYDYKKGVASLIRPTEMTVEERIPPRLRVRQDATMELPHIMLLIDDPDMSIIEPLIAKADSYKTLYDTELMQGGGHIKGWLIPEGDETRRIMERIEALADEKRFKEKYHLTENYPRLNLAVGDGNHSMATAKAAWEQIKKGLTQEEIATHPARYCLCEIVNVHDASLEVEPIHRVLFQTEEKLFWQAAEAYFHKKNSEIEITPLSEYETPIATEDFHGFIIYTRSGYKKLVVKNPSAGIAVATMQNFLDDFLINHPESRIDYIHGMDVVKKLGAQDGNIGIFLPDVRKQDLFIGVIKDGVLPRKTFSMGEANEKRYYMECKLIKS